MRYALNHAIDDPSVDTNEILRRLDSHFASNVRLTGVSSSTSATHRLLATAIVEVSAVWFDSFNRRLGRDMFVKALDALNANRNW